MSVVTEHLEQRGAVFEVLPHRQAYTSIDEARALGVDADEVLKTLAVRTGPGYVLVVIPAARRLDLQLVREALGDNHARLATEEELDRDFADYQLGALPPLGALVGANCVRRSRGTGARHGGVCGRNPDRVGQDVDPGAVRDRRDHDRGVGQAAGTRQRRTGRVGGVGRCVGDLTTRWALAWPQPWRTRHGGHWRSSTTPGLAVALVCHGRIVLGGRLRGRRPGEGATGDAGDPLPGRLGLQAGDRLGGAALGRAGPDWPGRAGGRPPATLVPTTVAHSRPTTSPSVGCSATPPACRSTAIPARPWIDRCHRSRPRCRGRPAEAFRWSCWTHRVDNGSTRAAATACSSCWSRSSPADRSPTSYRLRSWMR